MTFALDGTPLTQPTGGVARYTWELARALSETFPEENYWLLSDHKFATPAIRPANLHIGSPPKNLAARRWWLWGLNRELDRRGVDLFHGTDFSVPYFSRRPSVMTVHDLSPWIDAEWQNGAWRNAASRVRKRTPRLLRWGLAKMVITPTEAIRAAVVQRFRLAPEHVVAVPLAARQEFRPVNSPAREAPYFLFVGTLEPRKNITRIIGAWREVSRRYRVDLVLAGRPRADFAMPADEPGLRVLRLVEDAELPALYSGALATLYPSAYEGFGLPVLEAMQCGSLVIASRDPAVAEVAGGAAIHVDANDTGSLAQAMIATFQNPGFCVELRQRGLRRAAQFSWHETARRTREVYGVACARA
ncbi:MAG: glycosyltransferase family 1 protein [Acidobacteriota bacterium]